MNTTPPPDLRRLLEDAFRCHRDGDLARAEQGYRQVLASQPDQPDANHLLGVLLDQTGRGEAGAERIRRTLATTPDNPEAHCNLGKVLAGLGRLDEAVASYEAALRRRPQFVEARFNLGVALRRLGRLEAAIDSYRRLVAQVPGHAAAWFNLGNALEATARPEEARACWRRALTADPALTAARVNLANAARARGDVTVAEAELVAAVGRDPDHPEACRSLASLLRGRSLTAEVERGPARAALLACLVREDLEQQDLAAAATALLMADAPAPVTDGWGDADPAARRAAASRAELAEFLGDPLLHAVLTHTIVMAPALEDCLAGLRSALLDATREPDCAAVLERSAHWLAPLAIQCFRNEYVYPEEEGETARVEALRDELTAAADGGAAVDARMALLACYRPLHTLPEAESVAARTGPGWWPDLARAQIREPETERRLARELPRLDGARREVSEAVRRQYEDHPYPRWNGLYRDRAMPFVDCLRLAVAPSLLEGASLLAEPRVLIAGCGTGLHAISSALQYEGSRVLAVDLSRASLAYARRRAEELGVVNVEFLQADLLDLGALEGRFEVIESVGVLHHLAEPAAGWRVLRGLLAPGGYMKVGLYSAQARQPVLAARALIEERGMPPTPAGIRAARAAILSLPPGSPARAVAAYGDFYSTSGVRDLLFHVQEHRFTLPEIRTLIESLDLEFLGFVLDDAVLNDYRSTEADDPLAVSLDGWARYEAAHPETFGEMYQFWLRAPSG